jgi:hypothetical protein
MKIGEKQSAVYVKIEQRTGGKVGAKSLTIYGVGRDEAVSRIKQAFTTHGRRKGQKGRQG